MVPAALALPSARILLAVAVALLLSLVACGDGGNGGASADPPLAYVLTECNESTERGYTHRQALLLRRGDAEPLTVAEFPPVGPLPPLELCKLWGRSRTGIASVITGAFQRIGMSPDGSVFVVEVTDDFSIRSKHQVSPEQEGIFVVRTDGGGLRRIANASRNPCFRFDSDTGAAEIDASFAFSPDGSSITFTDIGPGPAGDDAAQVFTMDLATGTRRQVTRLPAALDVNASQAPVSFPLYVDADTITFTSYSNPVIGGEELNPNALRRAFSVKTDDPEQLRVVPFFAEPGSRIIEAFQISGTEPVARDLFLNGEPVNGPGIFGNIILEVFVVDGSQILQLTNFHRSDTAGPLVSADRQRISFYASANPPELGTNPLHNCQLFSIERTGRDLRQLTNFSVGGLSERGCTATNPGPGCIIYSSSNRLGTDPATGSILFASTCDPFGTNPNGDEVFAIEPDGTNLRQLTHTRGFVEQADGSVTVEFPGPAASPVLGR